MEDLRYNDLADAIAALNDDAVNVPEAVEQGSIITAYVVLAEIVGIDGVAHMRFIAVTPQGTPMPPWRVHGFLGYALNAVNNDNFYGAADEDEEQSSDGDP